MKLVATLAICVLCTSLVLSPVKASEEKPDKIFETLIDIFESESGFGGRGGSAVDSSSRFCASLVLLTLTIAFDHRIAGCMASVLHATDFHVRAFV